MITKSPLSCNDLANQIKQFKTPVLLLDTCTILDVVRAPIREQIGVHDIEAVHTLLARATGETPKVSLLVTEQVVKEFQHNIDEVERKSCEEIKKAWKRYAGILERMKALSPSDVELAQAVNLSSLGFPQRSRRLAEQVIQASSVLSDQIYELQAKAYRRVVNVRPPAQKSKDSTKDCLIIESYLQLARQLYSDQFPCNMVFTTSNKRDYEKESKSLHPELRQEFDSVGLRYSPSWSSARYELDQSPSYR